MIPISKPNLDAKEQAAVMKVLKSGIIASGPKVKEFEAAFGAYQKTGNAIAVSNGTCAIHAALYALGIKKGDKVITTPFTFFATASTIVHAGAEPVFVDIEEDSFNIDPVEVEKALKKDKAKKIKAIVVVHLYGQMCNMDAIMKIAKKYRVKVVEDAAQAHGSKYKGKFAGQLGDAATFSMYATKNMTTSEGGMVLTNDPKAAETARSFINHGMDKVYHHVHIGYNYRTTDIEAAIGLVQLAKLDGFNAKRRKNALRMNKILSKYDFIVTPVEEKGKFHIYHQYTIRVKNGKRDALLRHLASNGVGAKVFYPIPLHKQPVFKKMQKKGFKLPVSEQAAKEVISLPVHPGLTDADFKVIEKAFKSF